jgi:hypothetical protein
MIYEKLLAVKSAWITLTRDTKRFNYKYATLDQMQSKLWDILEKNKLLIIHHIKDSKVITKIIDTEDGSFVESEIDIITTKPQDKWSEITYYRRYNLLSLLDLEVEDDDWKQAQESKFEENNLSWINDTNIENLRKLISEWKTFTIKDIREKYKIANKYLPILNWIWIK